VSHAQFWVFPLSRRNLKDALSEHHPAEGGRVGALAGLKVSPLQNLQPNWQFESIVEALTPSAAKQYLSRRIDILSEFRVNHAQSCSFPLSRLKVKEATSLQPQLLHVDRQVSKLGAMKAHRSQHTWLIHQKDSDLAHLMAAKMVRQKAAPKAAHSAHLMAAMKDHQNAAHLAHTMGAMKAHLMVLLLALW
jgi:hypothetical protein